jgi:hypothetical protein
MEGYETKIIEKAFKAEKVRQEEIHDQLSALKEQIRTLLIKRALMEAAGDQHTTLQHRELTAQLRRLYGSLWGLRNQAEGVEMAIEGLEAKLKESEE